MCRNLSARFGACYSPELLWEYELPAHSNLGRSRFSSAEQAPKKRADSGNATKYCYPCQLAEALQNARFRRRRCSAAYNQCSKSVLGDAIALTKFGILLAGGEIESA